MSQALVEHENAALCLLFTRDTGLTAGGIPTTVSTISCGADLVLKT